MVFQISKVFLIYIALCLVHENVVRCQNQDIPINGRCPTAAILCSCSNRQITVNLYLDRCSWTDHTRNLNVCRICNDHIIRGDLCEGIENCRSCINDGHDCVRCPPDDYSNFCYQLDREKRSVETFEMFHSLPNISLPFEVFVYEKNPLRGHPVLYTTGCEFPAILRTAQVQCVVRPNKVHCVQRCIWGHTLPQGSRKKVGCRYKERKWTPSPLQECRPFVDCNLKIATPGEMKCRTEGPNEGPSCRLSCRAHGNKPSVPSALYRCLTTGEWTPPLPHCMEKDLTLELVPYHPYSAKERYRETQIEPENVHFFQNF